MCSRSSCTAGVCRIWQECILRRLSFMKNIKYSENEHCRTRSSRRNDSCRRPHQTGILRVIIKRTMSRGQKHTSNACSKQSAITPMACKKSGFKSDRARVEPIEAHGACPTAATKSQGTHACYSSDVGGHSTTVSSQIHYINEDNVPCCNCRSRWTYKVWKRNQIRRDLILQFLF